MKNIKNGIIRLILILFAIVGMGYVGISSMPLIKKGLDLEGGVSITYQAVKSNPTREEMEDATYKLQLKAQDYSSEAEVYREGSDKINIDIPGVKDATAILEELGKPGNLYFVEGEITYPRLATASDAVATGSEAVNTASMSIAQSISSGLLNLNGAQAYQNPDGTITIGGTPQEGATLISNDNYDYSAPPEFEESQIVLRGTDIASAQGGMYQNSLKQTEYAVDLTFTEEGKQKFADATARNLNQVIYIIYNDEVVSAPVVQAEITDGRAQINGMENLEAAERLASTIRIGALPIELKEIRSNVVGAKLGQDAITTSLKAGVIGFIIVCLFMIIVYRLPGFGTSLALTLYVALILFLLQAFEVTLTLPGIAGIILSIGMAVDANVIIFTRIKEEIGSGKSVANAVHDGFDKALSAIIDGNVTTLIASAVLYIKGTGTIRGFAVTLALGVVLSMFTAIFVTKFILNSFVKLGFDKKALYGERKAKKNFDFIKHRFKFYAISLVLICVGLGSIIFNKVNGRGAFNFGIDFAGGASTTITFEDKLTQDQVTQTIVPIFEGVINEGVQTQLVADTNDVIIKSRTLTLEERDAIYQKLEASDATYKLAADTEPTTENISGVVSSQMTQDAFVAVILSTIFMLLYIWFRFKDVRFASAAVLCLIHDCLITIGFYGLFRWSVDSTFIACMLTIVGYSINATIVIFDMVRENLKKMKGDKLENIVNSSVNRTFTRSMNTSLTTFVMVLCIYILGVTSIKLFALPLMIGIAAGAFSSTFIAAPLWFDLKKGKASKEDFENKPARKQDDDVVLNSIKNERKNNKKKK